MAHRRKRNLLDCKAPLGRWVLIALVMLSLTVSLATRTFRLTVPHGVTVQSNAAKAMRQHMVRDAAEWVPPAPLFTTLSAPKFYPHVSPTGPPLGVPLLDETLNNRPPPAC
jgi:hypothetical protein